MLLELWPPSPRRGDSATLGWPKTLSSGLRLWADEAFEGAATATGEGGGGGAGLTDTLDHAFTHPVRCLLL